MKITLIAALDSMGGIGKNGALPWYIPEDLKHFKEYTDGKVCVMGRKTWDSLPVKPLPSRESCIITSRGWSGALSAFYDDESVSVRAGSDAIADLLEIAHVSKIDELVIIGGASIYEQFLPHATHMVLTSLDKHYHCDTFFPDVDFSNWNCTEAKVLKPALPSVIVKYWEREQ